LKLTYFAVRYKWGIFLQILYGVELNHIIIKDRSGTILFTDYHYKSGEGGCKHEWLVVIDIIIAGSAQKRIVFLIGSKQTSKFHSALKCDEGLI